MVHEVNGEDKLSEKVTKKKNADPGWFEKPKELLGAEGESFRLNHPDYLGELNKLYSSTF